MKQSDNKENEGSTEGGKDERQQRREENDEGSTKREERRDNEGIEETRQDNRPTAPACTADRIACKSQQFDWVMDINMSIC